MNNKRKSKVVDTFMEEEMEKCKIFGKFESMADKGSSEIVADEKKILGVKVRRKSVISENEIFLESLKPRHKFLPTPLFVLYIHVGLKYPKIAYTNDVGSASE